MKKYISYFLGISLACIACDDILEEDITDGVVTLVAPADMQEIEGNTVQFRWDGIQGADEYRIQVNNTTSNIVVIDSLVTTNLFDTALDPGSYQWRVRGENFAYVTAYSFDSMFSVIETDDLTNQTVTLTSPDNESYFAGFDISFSWDPITVADTYSFEMYLDGNATAVVTRNDLVDASFSINNTSVSAEGKYTWQVSAANQTSATQFSQRVLYIDTTDPAMPELTAPNEGASFSTGEEVTFTWTFAEEDASQSPISGTIEIADNQEFNNPFVIEQSATGSYITSFTEAGSYFWRVRGTDAAENVGEYNSTGDFVITN